jgi:hypothetical protein
MRGLINHVWSNDLGAGWIDHHSYYSYIRSHNVGFANQERHTYKSDDVVKP